MPRSLSSRNVPSFLFDLSCMAKGRAESGWLSACVQRLRQLERREARSRLRAWLESLPVERAILVVVLVYAILIFLDLGTNELFFPGGCDVRSECVSHRRSCTAWLTTFVAIDLVFLSLFAVEILLRLCAFGPRYLLDWIAAFDALVVGLSFVFLCWQISSTDCDNATSSAVSDVSTVARLIRILRVFRLLTFMNKLNRTRQAERMMRQKATRRTSRLLAHPPARGEWL